MVDNGSMQVSLSNSSGQYPDDPLATILERAIAEYHPAPTHSPADSEAFRVSVLKMLSWAATLPAIGDRIPLSLTILSTGMRSVVLRVRYGSNPHTPWQPESVILKRYRRGDSATNAGGFGYLREKYGAVALDEMVPDIYPALYGVDDDLRCLALEDVVFEGSVPVANSLIADTSTQLFNQNNTARAFAAYAAVWGEFAQQGIFDDTVDQYRASLAKADRRAQFPGAMPSPKLAEKGLQRLYPDLPAERSEDAEEPTNDLQELIFRFHRITQPFFLKRPPVPEQFKRSRGQVYILSSGDFSPHNVLYSPADTAPSRGIGTRAFDTEGTCIHHRGFPFVEAMLGFPSSPQYPLYRVDREQELPKFYTVLFGEIPLDARLAEDIAVCAAITVCTLLELYADGARARVLPRICRQGVELMRILLTLGNTQDPALYDLIQRLGDYGKNLEK